uniref:Uncharacterized protein n=1 Tax=Anthurium amnicola TaxID=1678845 RepID=A0A1D1ZGF3_9ARAE
MAAPPTSASPDPAVALPPASASPNPPPPRPFISSIPSPLLPLPSHFPSQSILGRPPNPVAVPQGLLYPICPPARGFPTRSSGAVPRPHAGDHHVVTVANPAGYLRNSSPTAILTFPAAAVQARPLGFPSDHAAQVYHHQRHQRQQHGPVHQARLPQQPQAQPSSCPQFVLPRPAGGGGVSAPPPPDSAPSAAASTAPPPPPKSVPAASAHPKVTSFQAVTSNPELGNFKDLRDKSREDGIFLVSDRKVRLSESPSGSLYALCRSWVRNGLPQEIQANFGDGIKLLPRPLPLKVAEPPTLEKSAVDAEEDDEKEEHADSVDKLSAHDLLQRHINRAKRVRARLREERLQRIERYKQRLSLLLPLPVEQTRSDAAPGD